jgi:glutamyl-tRNA synthetase
VASVVGRLAPSPTGAQHVGNARTYLLAWLAARSAGGRVILRIEDLDVGRNKPGAVEQAIADLRWLGLDWDEGPDIGGPNHPYRQTDRLERYQAALDELKRRERVYPCICKRADLAELASAPHESTGEIAYPGRCASRRVIDAEALERSGVPFVWRFRVDPGEVRWVDERLGPQTADVAARGGDFPVQRSDGVPSYQLAVTVDDAAMGVTEVVRGDDLVISTFRQVELYRTLGWREPRFTHVPLVVDADGRRLAKRRGDTRMAVRRDRGDAPDDLVGRLAWSCGLIDRPEPCRPIELLERFDWSLLPPEPHVWRDG